MNGELTDVRAEQRAVTAFTLALLAAAVSVVALGLFFISGWWNFTVMIGTAVVGAIAVSIGDKVRHQAPSKGQAAVMVSVVALSLTVLHLLLLIGTTKWASPPSVGLVGRRAVGSPTRATTG